MHERRVMRKTDGEGAPPCRCNFRAHCPHNPQSLDYLGPDILPKCLAQNRAVRRHHSEN